jgi:hypothetical protein
MLMPANGWCTMRASIWAVSVCWNCLCLNQAIFQTLPAERQALVDSIAHLSPVSWQHINL